MQPHIFKGPCSRSPEDRGPKHGRLMIASVECRHCNSTGAPDKDKASSSFDSLAVRDLPGTHLASMETAPTLSSFRNLAGSALGLTQRSALGMMPEVAENGGSIASAFCTWYIPLQPTTLALLIRNKTEDNRRPRPKPPKQPQTSTQLVRHSTQNRQRAAHTCRLTPHPSTEIWDKPAGPRERTAVGASI